LEHFAERAHGKERFLELFTMPLPSLFIIFVLSPFIIKLYALFRSVAALDPLIMSKTLAYMKEEKELKASVVKTLQQVSTVLPTNQPPPAVLPPSNVLPCRHQSISLSGGTDIKSNLRRMFDEFDADNSGNISKQELRHGLSSHYSLNFTEANFDKVMRVVDPDQGGAITLEEFQALVIGKRAPPSKIERVAQLHSI
jgi:hypothetical protein